MGEEDKKPEEKKVEEEKKTEEKKVEEKKPEEESKKPEEEPKKEEKKTEEESSKDESKEASPPQPPPPPEEIVLRVFMHCEGCARKVKKCLRGFEGVEDVLTDCKTHKVIVKGKKAAEDPLKVLERIQKKSHRKVELLSPIPKPPAEEPKKADDDKENIKPEVKKEEPQVIIVVIKVHMHCEACAQEIQKRIQRMKGVQSADPDLKSSQVTVKGVFDPQKLVEYVYKRTGKHAAIVKSEPEKKKEEGEEKKGEEKKTEDGGEKKGEEKKKEEEEGAKVEGGGEEGTKVELKKNEFLYYPSQKYTMEYVYPPQIFSDENPNACSVM